MITYYNIYTYMTYFQNESIYIQKTQLLCDTNLHYLYKFSKTHFNT